VPRVECTCLRCGRVFLVWPSWAGKKYCSWACRITRVERTCVRCGKAFTVLRSDAARGVGVYCSVACRTTRTVRPCRRCGAPVIAKAHEVAQGTHVYCSVACAHGTHGDAGGHRAPEYQAWANMRDRCFNPRRSTYRYYGGRGITVCDRWWNSYENFLADVGRRPGPGYSLDRIDVNGNYEPGNVRWATRSQQNANQRPRGSTPR